MAVRNTDEGLQSWEHSPYSTWLEMFILHPNLNLHK